MKKIIFLYILIITLGSCKPQFTSHSENRLLMGTICIITLYEGESTQIYNGAFRIIEELDLLMSLQKGHSELAIINENAGKKSSKVSDHTFDVLEKSLIYSELSQGAFDPTIAPLVELWGISGDEKGVVPKQSEIDISKKLTNYKDLTLSTDNEVFLERTSMKIDLGGIAKGYIADKVKEYLLSRGVKRGIINLGGNIVVIGSKPEGQPWNIGIRNPFDTRGKHIGIAQVIDKTVVTSGIYERYFYENNTRYHHILDAKTGYPVVNDLASVTIISDNSMDADALSTSLFVLGVEEGMKLIETIGNSEVIYITKDKKVIFSSGAKTYFTINDEEYELVSLEEYKTTF